MAKKSAKAPTLIINEAGSVVKKNKLQTITANITKDLIRNDTMEGRDFIVVPMVMIVEGVLNGSEGPILYPADELQKIPAIWNTKPIVVYHPVRNNEPVSACSPDIITNYKIGVIMNAHTVNEDGKTKLKAEAWLEKDRMAVVDNRVSIAIENEQTLELSTGLFLDAEETSGTFDGVEFTSIARNFRPDHLAVLPDQIGACSIDAGAGFIRANSDGSALCIIKDNEDITDSFVSVNQMQPNLFKPNSFKLITLSKEKGIKAIVGDLKEDSRLQTDEPATQSFLFNKETWNAAKAKKWTKTHEGVVANSESRMEFVINELSLDTEIPKAIMQVINRKTIELAMPYLTINQISHDNLRHLLFHALEELLKASANPSGFIDVWITAVFDNFVIYEFENKLWKLNYTHNDLSVTLEGDRTEVVQVTEFRTVDGAFVGNKTTNNEMINTMNKKEIVDNLIANHGWAETDRELLMNKTEEHLKTVLTNSEHEDTDGSQGSVAANATAASSAPAVAINEVSVNDYISKAPAAMQGMLRSSVASHDNQKAELVAGIIANAKNTFTEDQLTAKSLEELQAINAFAVSNTPGKPSPNYVGNGDVPADLKIADTEKALEPTANLWSDDKS